MLKLVYRQGLFLKWTIRPIGLLFHLLISFMHDGLIPSWNVYIWNKTLLIAEPQHGTSVYAVSFGSPHTGDIAATLSLGRRSTSLTCKGSMQGEDVLRFKDLYEYDKIYNTVSPVFSISVMFLWYPVTAIIWRLNMYSGSFIWTKIVLCILHLHVHIS